MLVKDRDLWISFRARIYKRNSAMKRLNNFDDTRREKINSAREFVKRRFWLLLIFSICLHNQLKFHNSIELNYKVYNICWCKETISKRFQTCLYCIYIMLLTNDLAKICGEMSKIWLMLWIAYTCNVKGLKEVEKMGWKEMYFALLIKIIRVEWL